MCKRARGVFYVPSDRWPVYWFGLLEKAIEDGDHVRAGEAQKKLESLGVFVRYTRPLDKVELAAAT